jgi:hypothetical protein
MPRSNTVSPVIENTEVVAAPEVAEFKVSLKRVPNGREGIKVANSEGVKKSWENTTVAEARRTKEGVSVHNVDTNEDIGAFTSLHQAFCHLIPEASSAAAITFRGKLKTSPTRTLRLTGTPFVFRVIPRPSKDEAIA